MRLLTSLLTLVLLASTAEAVDLTIVTPKGYVTFTAGDDWPVIGTQTKMPVAAMAFQINDPADDDTPDSTNVAVNLYDHTTQEGREAMKAIGKKYGTAEPKILHINGWEVFDQQAV